MRPASPVSSYRRHVTIPLGIVVAVVVAVVGVAVGSAPGDSAAAEPARVAMPSESPTANSKLDRTSPSQGGGKGLSKQTTTSSSTTTSTTAPTSTSTTTTSTTTTSTTTSTTSTSTPLTVTGARLVGLDAQPHGYAEWRGITGGLAGEPFVVSSAADTGPGTYRDALSRGDRYITFSPQIDGQVIVLGSPVLTDASNITIDAAGRDITIARYATKFSGTNIVIAGMNYRGMDGSTNEDAITFRDASREQLFALYGNSFETATDGLVDVIWNRGNAVYGTICGNEFRRHDKALLVHSGDQVNEGGRYHVTLCENRWVDIYQRAPFTRDARIHQYNDVFERYGKPDGAGGGSKSGAESERSQHLLQNNIAFPRAVGEATWTGDAVTKPRTEYAGPQMGDAGAIRIEGSLLMTNATTKASQLEQDPGAVAAPPYAVTLMPADARTKSAVEHNAGACAPLPTRSVNPCAPIVTAPAGTITVEVDGEAASVVVRLDGGGTVQALPVAAGLWAATLPAGTVGWVDALVTGHHGETALTTRAVVTVT